LPSLEGLLPLEELSVTDAEATIKAEIAKAQIAI